VFPPTDPQDLAVHRKKEIKAKWMFLDVMKDHLIPQLSEKKTAKEMFDALVSLFQSENINKKMILRSRLRSIEISSLDTVTNYPIKVTQLWDQLAVVGEKVEDTELVNLALNGFPSSWHVFV